MAKDNKDTTVVDNKDTTVVLVKEPVVVIINGQEIKVEKGKQEVSKEVARLLIEAQYAQEV